MQWPVFTLSETEAVTETEPPHFKIAIGGSAKMIRKEAAVKATVPTMPGLVMNVKMSKNRNCGGAFRIMTETKGSTVSILVPGEEPLQLREATEQRFYHLLDWFAAVEMHAWRRIDCYFSNLKPKSIFIVTGQTLSMEYSISHKEYGSTASEVIVETSTEIPPIVDASILASYGCKRVVASTGFEEVYRKDLNNSRQYSIVLQIHTSTRIQRFQMKKPLRARVESCYK